MSFSVTIEVDHVYVAYSGIVEALDVVVLFGDQEFIRNLRLLQNVIHDFSHAQEVLMDFEDIKNLTLLSKLESNFTENLISIFILKNEQDYAQIVALRDGINNDKWKVLIAHNYTEARLVLRSGDSKK